MKSHIIAVGGDHQEDLVLSAGGKSNYFDQREIHDAKHTNLMINWVNGALPIVCTDGSVIYEHYSLGYAVYLMVLHQNEMNHPMMII